MHTCSILSVYGTRIHLMNLLEKIVTTIVTMVCADMGAFNWY